MVRKFDRISIEFSIEFFGRKFYRIFLAGYDLVPYNRHEAFAVGVGGPNFSDPIIIATKVY